MSTTYHALRNLKENKNFKSGDVLVLFGELFAKGYATGLVDEAKARGMKVIYSTVGRRDKDGTLRSLNAAEIAAQPQPLINIPLEAGFDLEPDDHGISIVDHLKDVKLNDWENFALTAGSLEQSKKRGRTRFQKHVQQYMQELKSHIPAGANVLFAHLMAGGVPRVKIVLPLMNRIVKGTGDRFLSSEDFTNTEIGKIVLASFQEVTAETFKFLLDESEALRKEIEGRGNHVSYLAYGYHGTEVLMGGNFNWQSYSPYVQGWAKMKLEGYSTEYSHRGVNTCVYNCPEILTNSSAIFSGVEVSLYPLLGALEKQTQSIKAKSIVDDCVKLLKPDFDLNKLLNITKEYLMSDLIRQHCIFERWPQHNSKIQLEYMLGISDQLIEMHANQKDLITHRLSEWVFTACGKVMINDSYKPEAPVAWINHDIIAKICH